MTATLVLDAKFEVPEYVAVMEWAPPCKVAIGSDAVPAESGADPSGVAPSANETVPVGVPAVELTVAVSVNESPKPEGFGADATLLVVAAGLTN